MALSTILPCQDNNPSASSPPPLLPTQLTIQTGFSPCYSRNPLEPQKKLEVSTAMASIGFLQSQFLASPLNQPPPIARVSSFPVHPKKTVKVVAAVGELSSNSTGYLIAGAAAIALFGTAFPILFSRKDTCPECDGAGFVREARGVLRANAARKDLTQIVCKNCNGLGKLNQVDK